MSRYYLDVQMSKLATVVMIFFAFLSLILTVAVSENSDDHAIEDLDRIENLLMSVHNHVWRARYKCYQASKSPFKPADCEDLFKRNYRQSGVYTVYPRSRIGDVGPIEVYCDMTNNGGGWTVIQRRGDYGRQTDYFFRDWKSYKDGFGDIEKDFWLGNDAIFALSNQKVYNILFDLSDFEGNSAQALYDQFRIDSEDDKYKIHIKDYSGNAGDSMKIHDGMPFITKAGDNDDLQRANCADQYKGAWWYNRCHQANLNGLYKRGFYNDTFADGAVWYTWKGYHYSLRTTEMKIRSKNFNPSNPEYQRKELTSD